MVCTIFLSLTWGFGDVFPLPSAVNFGLSSASIHLRKIVFPCASKNSLVGAQIFILIDVAKVQKNKMQNKLVYNSFPKSFNC
jgi:hypothetical protein